MPVVPAADATLYSMHCAGTWAWYWDSPTPGKVLVVSESPHNQCAGYSVACPIVPACAAAGVSGWFIASYGPDRCSLTFTAGPIIVVAGAVASGVWNDGGSSWIVAGAFHGSTCLHNPTRGVFYASETHL